MQYENFRIFEEARVMTYFVYIRFLYNFCNLSAYLRRYFYSIKIIIFFSTKLRQAKQQEDFSKNASKTHKTQI